VRSLFYLLQHANRQFAQRYLCKRGSTSCLALNRNAVEMPAIESGFDASAAAKKKICYD